MGDSSPSVVPGVYRGHVLLVCGDGPSAERLAEIVRDAGEDTAALVSPDVDLLEASDDDGVNLLVTDLDSGDERARAVLERIASGHVFRNAPRIHLVRDRVADEPDPVDVILLRVPFDPEELRLRVRLAAEIGRLRHRFIRDPMTTLYNREYVVSRIGEELSRARRYHSPLSLVLFDIDRLRTINARFGHAAGDGVIRGLCRALRGNIRKEDVLGRMGEGTFAALLPGNRYRGAAHFANKVRSDAASLRMESDHGTVAIRVSAGLSTFPDNPAVRTTADLLRSTERALTEAKARGGNRVFIDAGVLRHGRRIILLADTDPGLLDTAEDLLSLSDYRVVRAETIETMLETLRHRRPDLIVLDLSLAEEEAVSHLIEELGCLFPKTRVPILALSSPDRDPTRMGVDRFLTKPFSPSLLESAVRDLLDLPA